MAFRGCPACERGGHAVAFVCDPPPQEPVPASGCAPGIWRWSATLPVARRHAVSLGEGDTPLLRLPRVAADVGVTELYVKNEAANPTGAHKDRLAAVAVSAARQIGADVVTGASMGNHGAALAAYSAHAGLRCVIFATPSIADPMRAAIQVTGAELVMVPDADARYGPMAEAAERDGWLVCTNGTSPPVGSPPFAAEGYRTIAYEIVEQLGGQAPDWVVIPVSYGDSLAGMQRGFAHLAKTGRIERPPRLAAVEPHGALGRALATGRVVQDPVPVPSKTPAFSIAVRFTTDQVVRAVKAADGVAVTVPEDELLLEQHRLGRLSGIYAEVSSSITITAARRLVRDGTISADASVVCLLTATGLKDPATTLSSLPAAMAYASEPRSRRRRSVCARSRLGAAIAISMPVAAVGLLAITACGSSEPPAPNAAVGSDRGRPAPRFEGALETCSTRSEANFPGAFTSPDNLAVGPLVLVGGAFTEANTVREFGGNKFPLLVKAGHTVTVRLAWRARRSAGLRTCPCHKERRSCATPTGA